MAIYHCQIKNISRGSGRSSVASSSYRSGTKLTNERDGITHDYTNKDGILHSEVTAPDHAPEWATDREKLWNAVEKIETDKDARTAREFELALPNELTTDQQIELTREFAQVLNEQGMVTDWSMHEKHNKKSPKKSKELEIKVDENNKPIDDEKNPHVHMMATTRPFNNDGTWGQKSRKEYILDENGQKIKTPNKNPNGRPTVKSRCVETTNWNKTETLENWRETWANIVNKHLELAGQAERVDHRSNKERGIDQIPTVHLGVAATAMERRGERTELGDKNRAIALENQSIIDMKLINDLEKQIIITTQERDKLVKSTPPTQTLDEIIKNMDTQKVKEKNGSIETKSAMWQRFIDNGFDKLQEKKGDAWELSNGKSFYKLKNNEEKIYIEHLLKELKNSKENTSEPTPRLPVVEIIEVVPLETLKTPSLPEALTNVTITQNTIIESPVAPQTPPVDVKLLERNKKLQKNIDHQCSIEKQPPTQIEKQYIVHARKGLEDKTIADIMMKNGVDKKHITFAIAKFSVDAPRRTDEAREYAKNIVKNIVKEGKLKGNIITKKGGGGGMSLGGGIATMKVEKGDRSSPTLPTFDKPSRPVGGGGGLTASRGDDEDERIQELVGKGMDVVEATALVQKSDD